MAHGEVLADRCEGLGRTDNGYDSKSYLAWSNALPRALHDLGTEPAGVRSPSIADVLKA